MNEPWGFSGPEFAWFYAGLVVVPMLVGALFARLGQGLSGKPARERLASIYHFAYLAGGPDRVTDTVVAAMMEREQLRVSSSGKLYTTPQQPVDPLELEIARHLATLPSTAFSLYEPMRDSAAMRVVAADLALRKLVFPDSRRRLIWRVVVGVYAAVLVLGVARAVNGVQLGYPIGYLVGLMALAVVGLVFTARFARPRVDAQNTKSGQATCQQATGDRSLVNGAAGIVAKRGLHRYPVYDVSKALTKEHAERLRRPRRGRTPGYASSSYGAGFVWGGGGDSGGGCGSSCGGGGGGGGGCGGGGGG